MRELTHIGWGVPGAT